MITKESGRTAANKYVFINAIFETAREKFYKTLTFDDSPSINDGQRVDCARQELGQLLEEATVQFTTEQIALKYQQAQSQYEAHCERHGEVLALITKVIILCGSSAELSKSEISSAFDAMYADFKDHQASFDNLPSANPDLSA